LAGLPSPLQHLLNEIMHNCHAACSDSTETANAVTRELHSLLLRLVAAIDGELQSNPGSLRISSESWRLLGRMEEGINYHFQIRPRIMFPCQDADLQSAAAAARGIKDCITRFIELLSTDDERVGNLENLTIFLMYSEDDAEISMRFAFLDMMSIHVEAIKRPGRGWDATFDGETVRLSEDCSVSGSNAIIAPVLQFASAAVAAAVCGGLEDFDDANCTICLCAMFEGRGDGSVAINARVMKCDGKHAFHPQCARGWFVNAKHSICPCCRHDFSGLLCDDIAASHEHQVEPGFTVHWSKPLHLRLAALKMLLQLPQETPLGITVASALLWSCFDDDAGIAHVALRCGRLSVAIEDMPQGHIEPWCARLIQKFTVAETGAIDQNVAIALCDLSQSKKGRASLIAAGACGALVETLNCGRR
jgi:hypothetical protein